MKFSFSLTIYPPPSMGERSISISQNDCETLGEGKFLNDVIIDFYLTYLTREKLSSENKRRTHVYSCYFFSRLAAASVSAKNDIFSQRRKMHEQVSWWTKNTNIFEKEFIIVPINQK